MESEIAKFRLTNDCLPDQPAKKRKTEAEFRNGWPDLSSRAPAIQRPLSLEQEDVVGGEGPLSSADSDRSATTTAETLSTYKNGHIRTFRNYIPTSPPSLTVGVPTPGDGEKAVVSVQYVVGAKAPLLLFVTNIWQCCQPRLGKPRRHGNRAIFSG